MTDPIFLALLANVALLIWLLLINNFATRRRRDALSRWLRRLP